MPARDFTHRWLDIRPGRSRVLRICTGISGPFAIMLTATAIAVAARALEPPTIAAQAATASPARLNIPQGGNSSFQINFGVDRSPRISTVTLVSSPPGTPVDAYLLGDLNRTDNAAQLSMSRAKVSVTLGKPLANSDEVPVTIAVMVDPSGTQPGTYQGIIRVVSAGADPVSFPVSVTLQAGPGWLIFLIIAFGAFVGTFAKWLSDVASVLSDAERRYMRASLQLQSLWDSVPNLFKAKMQNAKVEIGQLDATAAAASLDEIDRMLANVYAEASSVKRLKDQIATQTDLAKVAGVPSPASAIGFEQDLVAKLLDTLDPSSAGELNKLDTYEKQLAALTTLLREYPNADHARQAILTTALNAFNNDRFAEGTQILMGQIPQPQRGTGFGQLVVDARHLAADIGRVGAGLVSNVAMFAIRNQRWLSAVVVGSLVALAGLQLIYFANPTFGANPVDYLAAFGWGAGLQIAGTTLSQIGTSLVSRGPKLS